MKNTNVSILRNVIFLLAISCMAIAGASPLFADITYEDSLVGYWNFNEGAGTLAEDSTGTNNGTLINTPTWTSSGKFGGALNFDGTGEYVNINDSSSLDATTQLTVEFWMNPTNVNSFKVPISKWNYRESGSWGFQMGSPIPYDEIGVFIPEYPTDPGYQYGQTTNSDFAGDNWYHIVMVYDGTGETDADKEKIYVNNIQKTLTFSGTAIPNNLVNSEAPVRIGAVGGLYDRYFNGRIDDVAIWNRALDADEVSSIYDIGVQSFEGLLDGVTSTFGDLGYTTAQIKQLTELYTTQESGQIGDVNWTYLSGNLPGDTDGLIYDIGDTWTYNGKYYIKLGSGLEGAPLGGSGSVPELPAGLIPLLGVILSFGLKRLKYFHK